MYEEKHERGSCFYERSDEIARERLRTGIVRMGKVIEGE